MHDSVLGLTLSTIRVTLPDHSDRFNIGLQRPRFFPIGPYVRGDIWDAQLDRFEVAKSSALENEYFLIRLISQKAELDLVFGPPTERITLWRQDPVVKALLTYTVLMTVEAQGLYSFGDFAFFVRQTGCDEKCPNEDHQEWM